MTDFRNPMDSIGIITHELARRLASVCEVTVYAAGSDAHEEIHEGVIYHYLPVDQDIRDLEELKRSLLTSDLPLFASDAYYQNYINIVAKSIRDRRFDLIHIHNLSQFVPVIRQLNPDAKIILHMHCDWLSHLDYSVLNKRLGDANSIISPSQYITAAIQQRFPQYSSRCQTLFNGVDIHRFMNGSLSQLDNQSKSNPRLLFVGRVSPEKGSHVLLEALTEVQTHFPEVELSLVGPVGVIPSEFLVSLSGDRKIQALAPFHVDDVWTNYLKKSLSLLNGRGDKTSKVSLHGAVFPNQLPYFYHQADIFVFPSVCHEAFGMPIAEAMIAGLPVVATQGGAFTELIKSGKSGLLVERSDSSALAKAILKLLGDKNLRQSIAKSGFERAIKLFSFDRVAEQLLTQYQSLIDFESASWQDL